MVSALDRKLLRDLMHLKAQIVSIAAVVACAVASVLAMRTTLESLQRARDDYYERARFPHVFATLKRAPETLTPRLAAIPGVSAVDTRVVGKALLQVPGLAETAQGLTVSIPADGPALLDALYVRAGRMLSPRARDEVLVNSQFADANRLRPGDSLAAVLNGQWKRLHIVGIAMSPEFISGAGAGLGQFTDNEHQGILWMRRNVAEELYDMSGAFNDVTLMLAPGALEQDVIARVDALLAPYGGGYAYGRKDQPSHRVVASEIEQLRVFGTAMPLIFLFVTAFLLNVVLSRLIATQREEIATLKAFGYGNGAIAGHYLGYPIAAVALGAVGGTALGVWAGSRYTMLYADFFRFPGFEHHTSVSLVIVAVLVSGAAAVGGAMSSVLAAIRLPPAEGMRPVAPTVFRPLLVERLGWGTMLSPALRMLLRNLERRPFRTAASIVGVALAAAILVVGIFAFDSARYMSSLQFRRVEREDFSVQFTQAQPARATSELAHIRGVSRVEPYRAVPVRMTMGHHERQVAILGLDAGGELRRLVDRDGRLHRVPPDGLVITTALARILQVSAGDTVTLDLIERGGERRRVPVVAELDELLGLGGYMEISALNRLMREAPMVSGAYLLVGLGDKGLVSQELARLPGVESTITRLAMLQSFDRQIAETLRITVVIVVSLASVVALGVIYNGIRISLSERSRELASLRVLGFTRGEVAVLLFGEQGVIDVIGTPLGLLLGLGLAHWIVTGFESELYRFPVVVTARTYLVAVGVIAVSAVGASLAMRRRVDRLDLVAVLKTRE